jgi:osmotically inducible lipoprotein OsmB
MQKLWILAFGLVFGVAACGNTLGEQAVFGGAAGAGVAVVTDGDPLTGAVVGGAANVAFCQAYPHRC